MNSLARVRVGEWGVLLLLVFSVLWKGGKSLESTWLLAGLAAILTLFYWWRKTTRTYDTDRLLEQKNGLGLPRPQMPTAIWVLGLLYMGWTILSYLFSETRNYGLDEVFRTCGYMLIFLWAARITIDGTGKVIAKRLSLIMTIVATVACAIGSAVYFLQPVNRFVGTFFDHRFHTDYWPNAWAEFILIAWPVVLLETWRQKKLSMRLVLTLVLGGVLSSLFLSYSRGAILAFMAQWILIVVLFAVIAIRDARYRQMIGHLARSIIIAIVIAATTAIALFFLHNAIRSQFHTVQSISEKVTFTAAEGTSSINERRQFWDQAWEMMKERPLVGWGPYSFRFVQPQSMEHVLATSDHPHNVFLKIAAERGIPATLFFTALFGYILLMALRSFFTTRKAFDPALDVSTLAYGTSIVGLLLHNLIDFNLQFVGIGIPAALCLALLVRPTLSSESSQDTSFAKWRTTRTLMKMEVCLAVVLLAVVLWEGVYLTLSSLGRHAEAKGNTEQSLYWYELSDSQLFSRDLHLSIAVLAMESNDINRANTALITYMENNSHDSRVWKIRGELARKEGDEAQALRLFQEAFERGKYTDLGMVRLLLESARAQEDATVLSQKQQFDSLFSSYAQAIEQNTHFIALSHNPEELMRIARILSTLYPADEARYKNIARDAFNHAVEERASYQGRPQGVLW